MYTYYICIIFELYLYYIRISTECGKNVVRIRKELGRLQTMKKYQGDRKLLVISNHPQIYWKNSLINEEEKIVWKGRLDTWVTENFL